MLLLGLSTKPPVVLPPDLQDLGMDDDQHDYDSVASDEDTDSELTAQNNNNTQRSNRAKVRSNGHTGDLKVQCVKFDLIS